MNIQAKKPGTCVKQKTKSALPVESSFWEEKTFEQLAKEQGIKPIKNEADFSRIFGGLEDWDDIEEFIKEIKGI